MENFNRLPNITKDDPGVLRQAAEQRLPILHGEVALPVIFRMVTEVHRRRHPLARIEANNVNADTRRSCYPSSNVANVDQSCTIRYAELDGNDGLNAKIACLPGGIQERKGMLRSDNQVEIDL